MKDVFRSGDSSKKFKIAEGQWYRYAPSYVSPAYHLLEGFPFIQEPPSGDLKERVRSEERFSRNAETDLVCRLLLEKKKIISAREGLRQHFEDFEKFVNNVFSSSSL